MKSLLKISLLSFIIMSFDYPGNIYYLHKGQIRLRNVTTKTDKICKNFRFYPFKTRVLVTDSAMGNKDDNIIAVATTGHQTFAKITFNKKLDIVKSEYEIKEENTIYSIDFLDKHVDINHGIQSIRNRYGKIKFPHEFKSFDNGLLQLSCDRWHPSLHAIGCYDKYTDSLLGIECNNGICELYIWKRDRDENGDFWRHLKTVKFIEMINHAIRSLTMTHFECSRQYIIIYMTASHLHPSYWDHITKTGICVLDKKTFKKVDNFPGSSPVCLDDFQDWYDESLEFLSKIEMLEKMSISLLRIILSYVA